MYVNILYQNVSDKSIENQELRFFAVGRQSMPTGLDECFSKKVSYYTGVLVVSSAYTPLTYLEQVNVTPIKNSCWENYLKTFTTSKQHVFGDKTVTVYRVEISTRTIDRAIDIV